MPNKTPKSSHDDAPDAVPKYFRPSTNEEALQIAIDRWIDFQYRVWQQEAKEPRVNWMGMSGAALRIIVIILAGLITAMSDVDEIPRTAITVASGALTILTGIDSFLKLNDRATIAENRRTEIMTEYDRQGYEWMTKVHLETDPDKALTEAKQMLETGPKLINEIVVKYITRPAGEEPTKPR